MKAPSALSAYRIAARALSPLAGAWLVMRRQSGKEDPTRWRERFAHTPLARPEGTLIWLHGASVGETRVLLAIRDALAAQRGELNFLITTATRTAGEIVAADAHARTLHQFAVIDAPGPVERFLAHWRPDLGVFAESEVWPNLILEAARQGVPLALVNACMGAGSLANWARAPLTAQRIFGAFRVILAADGPTAQGLSALTGRAVKATGNLKLAAALGPPDGDELAHWRAALLGRRVWMAASTHEGEDEIALAAHQALLADYHDALLIIAPRHPARGPQIAARAGHAPRRSLREAPSADARVYVADSLGEYPLFFAAAPVVLMGGSLLPSLEGHNPVEPTGAGAAVLSGPYVSSFAEIYTVLGAANGVRIVNDAAALSEAVRALWSDEALRLAQVRAAERALASAAPGLSRTIDALIDLLNLNQGAHARS